MKGFFSNTAIYNVHLPFYSNEVTLLYYTFNFKIHVVFQCFRKRIIQVYLGLEQ
jgi:hypothetical protein